MKVKNAISSIKSESKSQKWAVTLCCHEQEKLEPRVAKIIAYLAQIYSPDNEWLIFDIDATGNYGNHLTLQANNQEILRLSNSELVEILQEDGQLIELEATLVKNNQELFKIIIQDGVSIDVLGSDKMIPLTVIGEYIPVALFLW